MDLDFEHSLRYRHGLGKYVKVITIDSRIHEGWLKCINPIGGDLILVTFNEDFSKIIDSVLILGSKYKSLEIIKDADERIIALLKQNSDSSDISISNLENRKERLISWIKKHRLPITEVEDGSLLVCESVTVSAPYEVINCSSLNPRVLKNIRELVRKLPDSDFENHVCEPN